jgi:serine/threonine protein kinase
VRPGRHAQDARPAARPALPEQCERLLRDVGAALAYAHARGVVHRDVKPENIFLDAETGRALLADFGIARSADADSMTMTGTALGTPFYMSPEQVEGAALDGRSDLYSLGLVAWEALTGRRPWDGESLYNVIYKQKHEELPPIEALRTGLPLRLQYLVERMLQKRPGRALGRRRGAAEPARPRRAAGRLQPLATSAPRPRRAPQGGDAPTRRRAPGGRGRRRSLGIDRPVQARPRHRRCPHRPRLDDAVGRRPFTASSRRDRGCR